MAIFNETPHEKLQRDVATIMATSEAKAQDIIQTFSQYATFVWQHPTFTPQQVLDTFGTDAATLFALSNAVMGIFAIYNNGQTPQVVPTNYSYQINDDGTITLTFNPNT